MCVCVSVCNMYMYVRTYPSLRCTVLCALTTDDLRLWTELLQKRRALGLPQKGK